jgi:hypothetical protein
MPAEFPDCYLDGSVVGSVCAVHRIQYHVPFTSTTRPGQALSSRAAVYRNLQYNGADANVHLLLSTAGGTSAVFEFPKKPNTTSNSLQIDLQACKWVAADVPWKEPGPQGGRFLVLTLGFPVTPVSRWK